MTEPFQWPIRVYYEDTDAQGVVYYANYFRFMERARTEWLRALGVDQVRMLYEEKRMFVVTKTELEFIVPEPVPCAGINLLLMSISLLAFCGRVQKSHAPGQ